MQDVRGGYTTDDDDDAVRPKIQSIDILQSRGRMSMEWNATLNVHR